jgi:bifunctional DNA-binding transcriptional regulator/antitoxin component of YhaV-PrlF toxin-antitoxin module
MGPSATRAAPPPGGVYSARMRKKRRKRVVRRLRLDTEGRVRIPASLLRKAGVKPGDPVEVEEALGGVLIRPPAPPGLKWEKGFLVIPGEPSEEFVKGLERMKKEDLDREIRRCWPT